MINKFILISVSLLLGIASIAGTFYVRENVIKAYKIPSKSMEPTLLVGDHILVDRSQPARTPKRGDIIVFKYPESPSKEFVMRVVALSGDTVEIKDKTFYLNGKILPESYAVHQEETLFPPDQNPRDNLAPIKIPNDSYFVLGDNRDRSYDSRFWGTVSKDKLSGTVKSIYWSWDSANGAVRWDRFGKTVQ
ncbi:signal peptidase I [Trichlorobacter thiogenes]|uniref:Signal peptidase I n=1 Tax=Trichlorobacter thiogenes TaxID=115783 RepID=A0A1T4LM32_9BACT|nr:signal peptidase I [Trichlorobacter thiogenes]SJZ55598.1 signal peptidase I [Trichlorobacter thiogenes]